MQPETFAQPRLCVVGTGALGSALLERLRQYRFGSVLLVDPDAVETRNLHLSPLLRRAVSHDEAGRTQTFAASRNKAELLREAAQAIDNLPWTAEACEIADVGWADIEAVDLFCCCTDSVLSRVETSWIARALRKPLLDGGVLGQGIARGRVTSFPPAQAVACALCGLSEDRRAAVLGYAASTSLGCQPPETVPAMTGALATLNAVADAMLAQVLRWPEFAADQACTTRLAQKPGGAWHADAIHLTRSATCPWHDGLPGRLEALPWETQLDATLQGGSREVVLNWPVCTEAVCGSCGARNHPMQRVARLRRTPCGACGQAMQQPRRAVHHIQNGDPQGNLSPRQLGMPQRHLYWVR